MRMKVRYRGENIHEPFYRNSYLHSHSPKAPSSQNESIHTRLVSPTPNADGRREVSLSDAKVRTEQPVPVPDAVRQARQGHAPHARATEKDKRNKSMGVVEAIYDAFDLRQLFHGQLYDERKVARDEVTVHSGGRNW